MRKQFQFFATLIAVSSTVKTLQNDKQTPYRVGTIRFTNAQGVPVERSCMIWEKNFSRETGEMQLGETYLCTATIINEATGEVGVTCSHLTQGARASMSDFDVANFVEQEAPVLESVAAGS